MLCHDLALAGCDDARGSGGGTRYGRLLDRTLVLSYLEGLAFVPHDPAASGIYFSMAVGVAWTLCFEWYFYLVFGAAMLFGRWRYLTMAAWFALTLLAISLYRSGYTLHMGEQPVVALLYGSRIDIRSVAKIIRDDGSRLGDAVDRLAAAAHCEFLRSARLGRAAGDRVRRHRAAGRDRPDSGSALERMDGWYLVLALAGVCVCVRAAAACGCRDAIGSSGI